MRRGRVICSIALLASALTACSSARQTSGNENVALPDDHALHATAPADALRCTDPATIPLIEHVTDARWSPDSSAIALSRIVIVPSQRTVTGYEEDVRLSVLNLRTGAMRELGQASRPEWSGSGAYLSYWREDGKLYVDLGGTVAARIEASDPAVRWDGDTLYYWYEDEIRAWHDGASWTVANLEPGFAMQYPRDDAYFSADASQFTITRYSLDGTTERYIGVTRTGATSLLDTPDVTFTEWAPKGDALLLRTSDRIALREADGAIRTADIAAFGGAVHGWTADGRLLVGAVSPTVPGGNAIDRFTVWDPWSDSDKDVAELPNLLGTRSFSPDGSYFTGVARTGLYATQLEVFRCGVAGGQGLDTRADPASRSRQARIDAEARRFVRPVAGDVTQFLQGAHTGVDIAAPVGSVIVAADDGIVDAVGWVQVGGRRVCVQHANALESCYYHTSAALVAIGQRVQRGQPIALIGMTGATTGPHVHWEVKRDERIVDPLGL